MIILERPFPQSAKAMQRFLGAAILFKSFVPNFSDVVASLHDMTKSTFNWNKKTWTKPYEEVFEKAKRALADSTSIYFPDYSRPWIARVDASDVAVGGVLAQEIIKRKSIRRLRWYHIISQTKKGAGIPILYTRERNYC